MSQPRVTIIGAGRMGQGLGLALKRRGYKVILVNRNQREVIPPLVLHQGSLAEATDGAELVLIATPDDAIPLVAGELASARAIVRDQVVLHLSGLLDKTALAPLADTGAGLGSFHPVQSVAEPATAAVHGGNGEALGLALLPGRVIGVDEVQGDVDDVERLHGLRAVGGEGAERVGVGGVEQEAVAERCVVVGASRVGEQRRAVPADFGRKCRGLRKIVLDDQGGEVVEDGGPGAIGTVGECG